MRDIPGVAVLWLGLIGLPCGFCDLASAQDPAVGRYELGDFKLESGDVAVAVITYTIRCNGGFHEARNGFA